MLFSIIIPVYNVKKYLRHCLDSVLKQSYSDWEAVCVNDGSTDGSDVILKEYSEKDPRFRVITQTNQGLSSARNAGIEKAKGDYILFLDSDDWFEKETLAQIEQSINDEDMVCFSGQRFFESDGVYNPSDRLVERQYSSGMEYYNDNSLLRRDFPFVCVVLRAYKREFLIENRLRFKEGIYHEDDLFTPLSCYYAHSVRTTNQCNYIYRVRASSITTTSDPKRLEDMMWIANELAAFFIPKTGFDKRVIYRAITHHYQLALMRAPKTNRNAMNELCNWALYYKVSRTKLRHRYNYLKNRFGL